MNVGSLHIGLTIQFSCKTKLCILIRTQQLAPSNNDGECNVSSADIYNNMSSAMNKFNNALFKAEHKSHYSKQDVDMLDEYRTVVPVGVLKDVVNNLLKLIYPKLLHLRSNKLLRYQFSINLIVSQYTRTNVFLEIVYTS